MLAFYRTLSMVKLHCYCVVIGHVSHRRKYPNDCARSGI